RYAGTVLGATGDTLYSADLVLGRDRRWELAHIQAAEGLPALAGGAGRRLSGRFAVAEDGRYLVVMTRVPIHFRRPDKEEGGARGAASAAANAVGAGAAGGRAAPGAQPAVETLLQFSDADFANADWTGIKILDTTDGQVAGFHAQQVLMNGNPGSF